MPLATLFGRLRAPAPRRKASNSQRLRNQLRFETCEPRCTPAILLDVGTHVLQPNTPDQRIDIYLESTDPTNDPMIELMNLQAEIGDAPHRGGAGFDPYPNFQDVDFTGGIWDAFPNSPLDQTPGASPYHAGGWIIFESSTAKVAPDGKIVTLIVDTTGFTSGTFPLKFKGVGEEFGLPPNALAYTDFAYSQFNPSTNSTDIIEAPVTITNGFITIQSAGLAPTVDLNGFNTGTGFDAYFTQGDNPVAIVGASGAGGLQVTDSDSTNLVSATVTLQGVLNGTSETLAVSTTGTGISANYNSSTNTLSLTGSATQAAYQQVLRSLTYQNSAATVTPGVRTASVVVSDGAQSSSAVQANITTYDLSYPWHRTEDPTNVDNSQSGTTINDALIIVSDLRSNGSRQLPPTSPGGTFNKIDVDRNNRVTINDALVIVSHLRNQLEGEGEQVIITDAATNAPVVESAPLHLNDSDLDPTNDDNHTLALLAVLAETE